LLKLVSVRSAGVQVDRQAEDRCHRLGQTRPVWVHRMVLKGTVDNNIFQIAQRKLRLDKEVLEVSTRARVLLCAAASTVVCVCV
jgi:SNF2 family DNA or RNA helicase